MTLKPTADSILSNSLLQQSFLIWKDKKGSFGLVKKLKRYTELFLSLSFLVINSSFATKSEPLLFEAIRTEDKELYLQEMQKLLNGSIGQFEKTILFKTEERDTVFHLMVAVQSHQEFFAKEIQTLIYLFANMELPEAIRVDGFSLGGVKINIPVLEDTKVGQTIMRKDIPAIISLFTGSEPSAIEGLPLFHVKSKNGESPDTFVSNHLTFSERLSIREYIKKQNHSQEKQTTNKEFFFLSQNKLLMRNRKGADPLKVAYEIKNEPAYNVISDYNSKSKSLGGGAFLGFSYVILGIAGGAIALEYFVPDTYSSFDKVLLGISVGAGIGYGTGLGLEKCYSIFRNKLLKKRFQQ